MFLIADSTHAHEMKGIASWYSYQAGNPSHKTASGQLFNPLGFTAAHKTIPFGTKVRVTNLKNNKSVMVTINDRGPFVKGRIIDLSKQAAKSISLSGITQVSLSIPVKEKSLQIRKKVYNKSILKPKVKYCKIKPLHKLICHKTMFKPMKCVCRHCRV